MRVELKNARSGFQEDHDATLRAAKLLKNRLELSSLKLSLTGLAHQGVGQVRVIRVFRHNLNGNVYVANHRLVGQHAAKEQNFAYLVDEILGFPHPMAPVNKAGKRDIGCLSSKGSTGTRSSQGATTDRLDCGTT